MQGSQRILTKNDDTADRHYLEIHAKEETKVLNEDIFFFALQAIIVLTFPSSSF
jgi:hypothetical protein